MENYLALFTLIGSLIALIFAATRAHKVLKEDEGTDLMNKISSTIRS